MRTNPPARARWLLLLAGTLGSSHAADPVRLLAQDPDREAQAREGALQAAEGMRLFHAGEHRAARAAFNDVFRAALATEDEGMLLQRIACIDGLARFELQRAAPEGVRRELRESSYDDEGYERTHDPLRDALVRIHGFCPLVERARTLSAGGHDLTAAVLLARELELGDPRVRAQYETLWREDRAFAERVVRGEPWSATTVDELRREVTALVRGTELGPMAECEAPVPLRASSAGPRALVRCLAPIFDDPSALSQVHETVAAGRVSVIVRDASPYTVEGFLDCRDPEEPDEPYAPGARDPELRAWERGRPSRCILSPVSASAGRRGSNLMSFRHFVDDPSGPRVVRAEPRDDAAPLGELADDTEVLVTHFRSGVWDRPGWARIELPLAGWLYSPARWPPPGR